MSASDEGMFRAARQMVAASENMIHAAQMLENTWGEMRVHLGAEYGGTLPRLVELLEAQARKGKL